MATEALYPGSKPSARTLYRPVNRTVERIFFSGMAILLCVIVVIGFSRTYYMAGTVLAPLPNALVHVHGAAFSLWMILYLVQTALVSARRVAWHRTLGTIAFCLPPLMVALGITASIDGLRRGATIGPLPPKVSIAISLLGILGFAIVIAAAYRTRRKPDSHKRYILIATAGITEAAIGRFPPWARFGLSPGAGAVIVLGIVLLLPVLYDLVSLRRLHRATMWAVPMTFLLNAVAVPIGMTPVWQGFAGFLQRYVAPHV